jgi:hypothetical protein
VDRNDKVRDRIKAALAEPVAECARCETLQDIADKAAWAQGDAQRRMIKAQQQRLEARAEVERLKPLLDAVRAARSMLCQLQDHVSDQACDELLSILSDEPLDADGNLYRSPSEAAYQQGAEAMREAAARCVEVSPTHGVPTSTSYAYAAMVRALPIPEDKP